MKALIWSGAAGCLAIAAVFFHILVSSRSNLPDHMLGHYLVDEQDFLSRETVESLLENTRRSSPIFSTTKEPAVFNTLEEDIGEAVPTVRDPVTGRQGCPHRLLALDQSGQRCIFPGRVDVGRHYLMTGGAEAKKESSEVLVSRIQPFLHYILDYKSNPITKKLLEAPEMVAFAAAVCPAGKKFLNPFQFNYVVQLPGQTVASHVDAVYFRHASRFHIPQWLLSVMHFSGLFKDDFVDQVQVVAYYHKWTDERSGNFLFWNDPVTQTPQISKPISGSANAVDGSKVVHAAGVYMPWRTPPLLPRVARNTIEYRSGPSGSHIWDVKSNGELIATYDEDELRFSAVYRCKCFKDQADFEKYEEEQQPSIAWNVSYVLNILRNDLEKKGVLPVDANISKVDLGELLMTTYVSYPLSPTAVIPYNVCAIPEIPFFSFLKSFFSFFC